MIPVAVIGPGRVGTTLALALPDAYEVVAVAGGGARALARFTDLLPGTPALSGADAGKAADLVLVCVPDDALRDCIRAVARNDGVREGSRWVHVSGGHGLDVLRPALLAGASVAACHPAQTFPEPAADTASLHGAAWAVTAAQPDRPWARQLVEDLGGVAFDVPDAARTLYHAGLVAGSNLVTAIVSLARDVLLAAGVEQPEAFLEPLTSAAARHATAQGPRALTGPVRRGDGGTVAAHLAELSVAMPEAVETYVVLSRLALGYARRAGLDPDAADRVARILSEGRADRQ